MLNPLLKLCYTPAPIILEANMGQYGEKISSIIEESVDVKRRLFSEMKDRISSCAAIMLDSLRNGGKILICGNGGSASESMHFASELVGKLWRMDRPAIRAIALTTDPCIITSLSNDFGFEECFVRQVEGLGQGGDVLVAITTSGKSPNIIRAVETASGMKMKSVGVLGRDGGTVRNLVDDYVIVPSSSVPRIQENHHLLSHIFASIIEEELYGKVG
jgi:D-sedoheptulose 7-phosphate isomerase